MKKENETNRKISELPVCAAEYIRLVIKKMRYRREVRQDVQAELAAHFEDELKECATDEEKEQKAQQLITDFGDVKLLAVLLRRAKKRCRPLWRTIVARTFQTAGVIIVCFILYVVWFLTGKPTISVDYLALFNQQSKPEILNEDNAWPYYEKAIELLVEPVKDLEKMDAFRNYKETKYRYFGKLTEAEQEKIKSWVQQNQAAWQEFVAGTNKSYCYREMQYRDGDSERWLWKILLPHLKSLRYLSKAGIWWSRIKMAQGRTQGALEDCLAIARLGSHWQGKKATIVEQLFGLALSRSAHEEILYIVTTQKLSVIELKQLQQQLLQIYVHGYPQMNVEGERLMFLDMVQHLFTEGGPGGGHLLPKQWSLFEQQTDNVYRPEFEGYTIVPYTVAGMVHARRDETIHKANEVYDQLNEIAKMTPYERYIRNINGGNIVLALSDYRFFLIRTFAPALDRASAMVYQVNALHEAVLTVFACQWWQLDMGEYPPSLDDLVEADYLKELPIDTYSDNPLVYKKTEDGFILYSVGLNFKDDGGKVFRDNEGRVRMWADEGDQVFWPMPKPEIKQ